MRYITKSDHLKLVELPIQNYINPSFPGQGEKCPAFRQQSSGQTWLCQVIVRKGSPNPSLCCDLIAPLIFRGKNGTPHSARFSVNHSVTTHYFLRGVGSFDMVISYKFMWCCQTTSSKILPNHIWTHTNKNSSSYHLLKSLRTTYPKMYPICFRWPWSSSPSFVPHVAFLPHSLGKHHRSPPGWGSHCPGPTNSWPQCAKFRKDKDKLLKWYTILFTHPKKIRI